MVHLDRSPDSKPSRFSVDKMSVILPVYAETDSLRHIVAWLDQNLGARLLEIIVIVSPRSGRPTLDVCEALMRTDPRVRVYEQQNNPGLGHAVREGLARTQGDYVLSMDSDGEMEIETVP